jgi:hypothetical protein
MNRGMALALACAWVCGFALTCRSMEPDLGQGKPTISEWAYTSGLWLKFEAHDPTDASLPPRWMRFSAQPDPMSSPVSLLAPLYDRVVGHHFTDLDGNGLPEITVFLRSRADLAAGEARVYAWTGKGFELYKPEHIIAGSLKGYRGSDRFELDGDAIVRRFPVYLDDDVPAEPSGGTLVIRYRFKDGVIKAESVELKD